MTEMRTVLVTGGAGLLGSATARLLGRKGWKVRILDAFLPGGGAHPRNLEGIPNLETVETADIRDGEKVARMVGGCQAVFHAAAHTSHGDSMTHPAMDLAINVQGTATLLDAMRRACPRSRLVLASTRQIYGTPEYLPVDEKHPLRPPDVNGIGKRACEDLALLFHRIHGIPSAILRFTNLFGPGLRVVDARQMFLGIWIRRALEDGELAIFGDGTQRRDLLYVEDAASAVEAALERAAPGSIYNVGHDEPVRLLDLADTLIGLAGTGRRVLHPFPADRKAIDIGDYVSDIRRIHQDLAWKPAHALSDGLRLTLDYYRNNLQTYLERAV